MLCILDFGSQYTQLIARRLRGQGFSTEVLSGRLRASEVLTRRPGGIILSGSPASVGSPFDPDPELLSAGVPVLGLCFGYQYIASRLGGRVESSAHREYGAAQIEKTPAGRTDPLTARAPRLINNRNPGRKLRIGYVSADLRDHAQQDRARVPFIVA